MKFTSVALAYDDRMGGDHLLHPMLGYYRNPISCKKSPLLPFFHMSERIVVNTWLLFRSYKEANLPILECGTCVLKAPCRGGRSRDRSPGRTSFDLGAVFEHKRKTLQLQLLFRGLSSLDVAEHMPSSLRNRQHHKLLPPSPMTTFQVQTARNAVFFCTSKRTETASFHFTSEP